MSKETIFPPEDLPDEISILRMQLAISLKFHHSKTLEKLPKEVAIQVIKEVWQSCHSKVGYKAQSSVNNGGIAKNNGNNTIYL